MDKLRVLDISRDFYNNIIVITIVTNDIMSLERRKMTRFAQKTDFHVQFYNLQTLSNHETKRPIKSKLVKNTNANNSKSGSKIPTTRSRSNSSERVCRNSNGPTLTLTTKNPARRGVIRLDPCQKLQETPGGLQRTAA